MTKKSSPKKNVKAIAKSQKTVSSFHQKAVVKKTDKKIPAKKSAKEKQPREIKSFPVVGIGGSAGRLEAFSEFLQHLSPDLGMAYVYIQHLSPDHESLLPEIIQRKTKMKVVKINLFVSHIFNTTVS